MATACRTYSSELSQLTAMREFVGEACRQQWETATDEPAIQQLLLALQEAAANVIEHAYREEAGRPIVLMLETLADQVCITLYHQGVAFDPHAAVPPSFDGSRDGGFGVFMIEHLLDQISYFHESDGRSAVRLVKYRMPRSQE